MFFKEDPVDKSSYELKLELHSVPDAYSEKPFFFNQTSNDEIMIPCRIFRQGLSGLGAVIRYLKENHQLKYSQISKILNRDQRTIWTTYRKVKNVELKKEEPFDSVSFSVSILKDRNLSVLEAISVHLKSVGFSTKEISKILGKSNKTIWTVLNRTQKKVEARWEND